MFLESRETRILNSFQIQLNGKLGNIWNIVPEACYISNICTA